LTGTKVTINAGSGYTNPRYHDTLYGYDTYGNKVATTEYRQDSASTEFGKTDTLPGELTQVCYGGGNVVYGGGGLTGCADDGYRTYVQWTRDALGHQDSVSYTGRFKQ